MTFDVIDVDKWNRKEYYNHYFSKVPCTYSITTKIDITKIKEKSKNYILQCFIISQRL